MADGVLVTAILDHKYCKKCTKITFVGSWVNLKWGLEVIYYWLHLTCLSFAPLCCVVFLFWPLYKTHFRQHQRHSVECPVQLVKVQLRINSSDKLKRINKKNFPVQNTYRGILHFILHPMPFWSLSSLLLQLLWLLWPFILPFSHQLDFICLTFIC